MAGKCSLSFQYLRLLPQGLQYSHAHSGPGFLISDFESNRIIGNLQFEGAQTIMGSSSRLPISGPVKTVHTYMNMCVVFASVFVLLGARSTDSFDDYRSFHSFTLPNGTTVQTCPPALGTCIYSDMYCRLLILSVFL